MSKKKKDDVVEQEEPSAKKGKAKADDGPPISDEANRAAKLSALFKSANKTYGKNTLYSSEDYKFKSLHVIPTGITPLDYALGGGLPVGRISLFYGHKSTAKTTNILRIIGNAQKLCSDCWSYILPKTPDSEETSCSCGKKRKMVVAWLDVEGVWEDKWAKKFVTMGEDLLLSQPTSAEQTIDLAYAALKSEVDIIVIDSIAFMTSNKEQENSAEEVTVGIQARLMGNAMRRFVSVTNQIGKETGRRPTIIMTNQIRQKVGVMYGSNETVPGGLAAGFATSVEIKTSVGKYVTDDSIGGKTVSVTNYAKVEKNKMSVPKMEAEWEVQLLDTDLRRAGDIIDEGWSFTMGERAGLISVAPQNIECEGKRFRGRSLLETYWTENPSDYYNFRIKLMAKLLSA